MLPNKFTLINSIYLVFFNSKNRPKYTTCFYYSVRKETTYKASKAAAAKSFFSRVYVTDTTCFDEYFIFQVVTGRHNF